MSTYIKCECVKHKRSINNGKCAFIFQSYILCTYYLLLRYMYKYSRCHLNYIGYFEIFFAYACILPIDFLLYHFIVGMVAAKSINVTINKMQ